MADDKSKTAPQDSSRVNISEEYEVQYWTKRFGCTRTELEAAVKKAGPMVKDVEKQLKANE
jgi:Protein of unknown function (DUF3606)